ncbi:MAG: ABC transporter ATP-binding protein [Chlorobiota bacterium]
MSLLLRAQNLVKSFSRRALNDTPVLRGVSVELAAGEFVALVGPSGAGKSTLLHLLGTLDRPDGGTIELWLEGERYCYEELSEERLAWLRQCALGFVFQAYHLVPELTALENVMLPALIAGTPWRQARQRALELLGIIGMGQRAEHLPAELSGGEQQRVAIARALINRPVLILADEPTGSLDSANAALVLQLLRELQRQVGSTLVLATHSPELAAAADRSLYLLDGQLVTASPLVSKP